LIIAEVAQSIEH